MMVTELWITIWLNGDFVMKLHKKIMDLWDEIVDLTEISMMFLADEGKWCLFFYGLKKGEIIPRLA